MFPWFPVLDVPCVVIFAGYQLHSPLAVRPAKDSNAHEGRGVLRWVEVASKPWPRGFLHR